MSGAPLGWFKLEGTSENARAATFVLARGMLATPVFMPVGTAATVKSLTPGDLIALGAQIVLANTYHLWLRPGLETLVAAGGLNAFMRWPRPILTDSGGFQVFSLESLRVLSDEGVRFRSHLDGSEHEFTPESVVAFQEALGVDVAMALDVCVKLPAAQAELEEAVRLTTLWARRCAAVRARPETLLFGIVQGGLDEGLRTRSAAEIIELDLPGYAIGGLSVGESRGDVERMMRYTASLLPPDRPRYIMGIGTIRDVVAAIDAGIDMFDCVYPTRCGRNGRALTRAGDLNIRNARFMRDQTPLDPACGCAVCAEFTRDYISYLFRANEMLGPRLLSYHNLAVVVGFVDEARAAILAGTWPAFRDTALGACS